MKHDDTVGRLADYADHRSPPATEAEMRQHVEVCQACRDWVATYQLLRQHPEALHPESESLAAKAAGQPVPASIEEHLAGCPQCWQLVTNASHALAKAELSTKADRRGWSWNWRFAASVAAVLFVTLTIGRLLPRSPVTRSQSGTLKPWAGPTDAIVLSGATRSAENPEVLRLRPGQPYAAVGLDLGDRLAVLEDRVTIRVERLPDVVVWQADYQAQALRELDIGAGLLLFQWPTAFLEPGVYQVTVEPGATIGDRPIWQRRFAVVVIDQ